MEDFDDLDDIIDILNKNKTVKPPPPLAQHKPLPDAEPKLPQIPSEQK